MSVRVCVRAEARCITYLSSLVWTFFNNYNSIVFFFFFGSLSESIWSDCCCLHFVWNLRKKVAKSACRESFYVFLVLSSFFSPLFYQFPAKIIKYLRIEIWRWNRVAEKNIAHKMWKLETLLKIGSNRVLETKANSFVVQFVTAEKWSHFLSFRSRKTQHNEWQRSNWIST